MRLLIVRHGDPDYERDSLTETGWKEARLAAELLSKYDIKAFYVSPLGRAQDTASCTLEKMHRTAVTCDWLREFAPQIRRPDKNGAKTICWDWLPSDWTKEPAFFHLPIYMLQTSSRLLPPDSVNVTKMKIKDMIRIKKGYYHMKI